MQHAVTVPMTQELVLGVIRNIYKDFPEDSSISGVGMNRYGEIVLRINHSSFPEVAEGAEACNYSFWKDSSLDA